MQTPDFGKLVLAVIDKRLLSIDFGSEAMAERAYRAWKEYHTMRLRHITPTSRSPIEDITCSKENTRLIFIMHDDWAETINKAVKEARGE